MSKEAELQSHFLNDPKLKTLVGDRVRAGMAQPDDVYPFIVYQLVSGNPLTHLTGHSDLQNPQFQVACYGDGITATKALAEEVKASFNRTDSLSIVLGPDFDDFDENSRTWRVIINISVW